MTGLKHLQITVIKMPLKNLIIIKNESLFIKVENVNFLFFYMKISNIHNQYKIKMIRNLQNVSTAYNKDTIKINSYHKRNGGLWNKNLERH